MIDIKVAPGSRVYNLPEPLDEAIINAYRRSGIDCVRDFNGMFAFTLRDREKNIIYMARDRYGIKPWYYSIHGALLISGSTIKEMVDEWNVPVEVDMQALAEYFTFQNVFTDHTLFKGFRLLPAGCVAEWNFRKLRVSRYWDYRFDDGLRGMASKDIEGGIRALMAQAVMRQIGNDSNIGCFLSGGMDTGSIVALAVRQLGRLPTFSVGFDMSTATGLEFGLDERQYAEQLANEFATEHYEMVLHSGDMEAVMPSLIESLEELRVGQCYPDYYAMRLASRFVPVVLSGAGGDELFGGYPWRYLRGLNADNRKDYERRYYEYWQRLVSDEEKPRLFQPEVYRHIGGYSTYDVFREVMRGSRAEPKKAEDYANLSLYFEIKTFLHGLLVITDKIAKAHGLEVRLPFLDNDLVDLAMQIPVGHKLGGLAKPIKEVDEDDIGQRALAKGGKRILRRAMRGLLPDETLNRPKQGFSAPDGSWFRGESMEYVRTLVMDDGARIYEYLRPEYVRERFEEHVEGRRNNRLFIWSVISFENWLKIFIRR